MVSCAVGTVQWKAQQDRLLFLLHLKCDVAPAFMNISVFVGMLFLLKACWDSSFASYRIFTEKMLQLCSQVLLVSGCISDSWSVALMASQVSN